MKVVLERAVHLHRGTKQAIMVLVDSLLLVAALALGLELTGGSRSMTPHAEFWPYLIILASTIPLFSVLGLYRAILRYVGAGALLVVVIGVSLSVGLLAATEYAVPLWTVHPQSLVSYWAFALIFVGGSRIVAREIFVNHRSRLIARERVVIYGAGDAGAQLLQVLNVGTSFRPVAFVDDSPALQGKRVNGIQVLAPSTLPQLVREKSVERVLLAMPATGRRRRQEILGSLEHLGIRVQSIPELVEILHGNARVEDLRDLDVNDLLGRDPVPPNPALFRSCIEGKSVMVTGAGGSIGSELCRQIFTLCPKRIVLFEMSEIALYNIERELRQLSQGCQFNVEIIPLLGNAHHRFRVREVMLSCGVQTVYHAAAYKHVPLVEQNIIEGLHNNVVGTWYAAEAALEAGVEIFVLVSTDKAVNPANIMGATKRFAELVLQGLQSRGQRTKFCMVRFGNVLGSSGSVVPLFREQILQGGPVTVTHPEVIRYFMTIPEAVQLVIQAGAMSEGGDVFVLDMGQPVRIVDLAKRMITLMGLTARDAENPDGDIEIQFTGLRAAEKLFEELLIGSNVTGTDHPRIMRAIEHSLPWVTVEQLLGELLSALNAFDCRAAVSIIGSAVAEYHAPGEIRDLVWNRSALRRTDKNIALLPRRRVGDNTTKP
jgi:FlaA1/EpsC-like NDP-sugar epimerase